MFLRNKFDVSRVKMFKNFTELNLLTNKEIRDEFSKVGQPTYRSRHSMRRNVRVALKFSSESSKSCQLSINVGPRTLNIEQLLSTLIFLKTKTKVLANALLPINLINLIALLSTI